MMKFEVSPTKDPTKVMTVEFSQELIQDLKAICGLDLYKELAEAAQKQVDDEYDKNVH